MRESDRSPERLKIAIQKSGRLNEKSLALLDQCGLNFNFSKDRLFCRCDNFPVDVLLVRDDDIPEYVSDGVAQLGIVGLNVIEEVAAGQRGTVKYPCDQLLKLGFGHCRLSIAATKEFPYAGPASLEGQRIATSYPGILGAFLQKNNVNAEIVELSGAVEIAPTLDIADAICDLVSSGATLRSNGLKEIEVLLQSESVLLQTGRPLSAELQQIVARLLQRIRGSLKAQQTKYIMMNAPRSSLPAIREILPGMEEPSIMPLWGNDSHVAIHAVAQEHVFWDTMEKLKANGASSILILPIEKIID